ncbi:MAG: hypothetical protein LBC55_04670 [Desulfovibrio sp.]|nr:hypothetical protein [Desulfovibrio sp.]
MRAAAGCGYSRLGRRFGLRRFRSSRLEDEKKAALMTEPQHYSSAFRMQRPPCGRLPGLPDPAQVRYLSKNLQVFSIELSLSERLGSGVLSLRFTP